ncbi:MAG TPA: CerR family C-terminal domain-containing protein [Albitalea sp.]|jgi:AcrR family transcriptional regulator|nr:CerR family C-terminal domain-containing protein [Albitalea sp.]
MSALPERQRTPRSDGEQSRERLLHAGLRLFAQQGFAKTSTREIAEAANVNVAAISYYFGDKAGLYRAVFLAPIGAPPPDLSPLFAGTCSLADGLRRMLSGFIEPLKHDDAARLCIKLHCREMLEPTGLWQEEIANGIRPMHAALVALLCRRFALKRADDDVHRLAVSIAGLGVHLFVSRDVIEALAPQLSASHESVDRWAERLLMYAMAMIDAEDKRRKKEARQAAAIPRPRSTPRRKES